MKRTLEGSRKKQKRQCGFRARMRTHGGRNVIRRRRSRGRKKLTV